MKNKINLKKSRGNSSSKDERKATRGCGHVRFLQGSKVVRYGDSIQLKKKLSEDKFFF